MSSPYPVFTLTCFLHPAIFHVHRQVWVYALVFILMGLLGIWFILALSLNVAFWNRTTFVSLALISFVTVPMPPWGGFSDSDYYSLLKMENTQCCIQTKLAFWWGNQGPMPVWEQVRVPECADQDWERHCGQPSAQSCAQSRASCGLPLTSHLLSISFASQLLE